MDTVDAVAQAIFGADSEVVERLGHRPLWEELDPGDWGSREDYRRMARAAIDALRITNQCGAPGDTFECPACSADWVPVDYGPLDISWVRKDNTNE